MNLTDELFELGKNSKDICVYINDDYVLINKTMPEDDARLENYINSIRKAKKSGINITSIVDYKMIDGTTSTYGDLSYTKGVFLEERAKGNCIATTDNIFLNKDKEYDLNSVVDEYLSVTENYLEELEERAKASQDIYDKLVSDCLLLEDYNLIIDPKPLNFFFSKENGYTIIDVIPLNDHVPTDEFFPIYMFNIVYGYGREGIYVDYNGIYSMPNDMHNRFNKCIEELNAKIVRALRKNNLSEEYIKNALIRNQQNQIFQEDMNKEEIIECIEKEIEKARNKENEKEDISSLAW